MADPSPRWEVLAAEAGAPSLERALTELCRRGGLLGLAAAQDLPALRRALRPAQQRLALPSQGAALVVGSGGSSGGRRWCLQPLAHLEASAIATGAWLRSVGLEPSTALLVNPLPWHHVSGLMPWLRSRVWGARHGWLTPAQLRLPEALAATCPLPPRGTALLSLVPTQLHRLLAHPAGVRWLQGFDLIWVGGAALSASDAARSREAGLRLAPCYGSTETGSMVAALAPERFLAGESGCGACLPHAELRLQPDTGAVEVKATSLCAGFVTEGRLEPLPLVAGWWRSGDRGRWQAGGLTLIGRLDGAVLTGGETVFPEQVELALQDLAARRGVPLAAVLLLARPDPEWGERLVALVRCQRGARGDELLRSLKELAGALPPAWRPREWRLCPALEATALGKWDRQRWLSWLLDDR